MIGVMRNAVRFDAICLVAAFLSAAPPCAGQARKSIFVVTDGEGVAGICRQEQTEPTNPELRQLLTGEVNAAVEGFFAGGADEVVVWDGHDDSETLSAATIHERAKLIIGKIGPLMTFDRGYAALAFVGQHAMAGAANAIMAHSYNSLGIQNMLLNGKPVGEIETTAALAGSFGIPVVFLSGDRAAVNEVHAIVPDAATAEVKEGLTRYLCISLSAAAARDLIRQRAAEAARKIGAIKPYRIDGPVTLQIEYTTRNSLGPGAGSEAGTEVVNDRTIRIHGKDFVEAWTRYRGH
jgi:D-amino peptidase